MNTLSIIMAALIAGTTSGITQGTSNVINNAILDSYKFLKQLLINKSPKSQETKEILDKYEKDQDSWTKTLQKNISDCQLDKSDEIINKSKDLLKLVINYHSQIKDFSSLVNQLNTYGGKVIINKGNIKRIDM